MVITFCGHSELYQQERIADRLDRIVESLISEGADEFLLGGYGQFDVLAAKTVAKAKKHHPHIESILVIPYLDRKYDMCLYDRTLYPCLEHIPLRYAISKRNKYMVETADVLVAFVTHDWGGAAKMLEYAMRTGKRIINVFPYRDVG